MNQNDNDIRISGIQKVQLPVNDPFLEEEQTIVNYQEECTLEIDSPMLQLFEERHGENEKPKQHHGLAIAGILLLMIAIAMGGVYLLFWGEETVQEQVETDTQEKSLVKNRSERNIQVMPYVVVPENAEVLVNGVALKSFNSEKYNADGIPIVLDNENMVVFSALGYVPQQLKLEPEFGYQNSNLKTELMSDDIYQHSRVTVKLPKNADPKKTFVYLNGQMKTAQNEMRFDCVSGLPYYIQVQQEGYGDHLHVIWPTRSEETVELPEMLTAASAARSTEFNLDVPNEYLLDHSFELRFYAEDTVTSNPGRRVLPKDELVKFTMKKDGRFPMEMILDTTPFASITVKAYMQLASLGAATVKFSKTTDRDIILCFRRSSEAMCAFAGEENIIPSGKWELAAYETDGDEKQWFINTPYETLSPDATYTFSLSKKNRTFEYSFAKQAAPRKKKN